MDTEALLPHTHPNAEESSTATSGTLGNLARLFGLQLIARANNSAQEQRKHDVLRLRAAVDASRDAIFVVATDTLRFVDTNEGASRLLGYSGPEFLAMDVARIAPYSSADIKAAYERLIMSGAKSESFTTELIRKDGTKVPVQVSRYPLLADGTWYVIGVASDLSEAQRADQALAQSRELYQTLFDLNPLPMWVYDLDTLAFLAVNQAAIVQYGFTREEFLAMDIRDIRPAEDLARLQENLARSSEDFEHAGIWRHCIKSGAIIEVEITSHRVDFDGHPAKLVLANDVTARLSAEHALRASNERFELVARATNDIVWDWDLVTGARWWNDNLTSLLGYERTSVTSSGGAYWGVHPDDRERVIAGVQAAIASHTNTWTDEYRFRHRDGRYLDIYDRGFVLRNERGEPVRMIGAMMDITQRKRAAEELTHHLTHDLTTGLPRFASVQDYLQSAFASAAAQEGRVAVMYVDLDFFHAVNETRGRALGDEVLRTVALRLSQIVGGAGKVAHVAGDEFALIYTQLRGSCDQLELGERVRAAVAQPMRFGEERVYLTCSIGVSCFPDNATTPQELLRQAEAAAARAKRDGRNVVNVFSNDRNEELRVRLALGTRLRNAISEEHLLLHYQPQISGLNWQILGFEALLRWQDPDLGFVMPKQFIQAAEELGVAVDLGRYVLNTACRQARSWIDAGAHDFSIAVNISPMQLQRPDFVDEVRRALEAQRVPPRCIELELTESIMMENAERMISTMHALKELGVRLALDDFGTGYSSLNYLRRFPLDCLKIDQSFVREVTTDSGSAGICRAVIELGHQLGMQVLAEGVETAAQVGYLRRNNCDLFQGFYFSKPVTSDQALELLRHRYLEHEDAHREKNLQTLLLVDDETNVLNALNRVLRRDGYRILSATSAEDALDILAREEVSVILSDQRMPGMSGTELLSKVKDMHPHTVRMVLSGYTDLGVVTEAINQGAIYKFLTKPWNDEALRLQIQDAFRTFNSRLTREAPGQDLSPSARG
jgi:diguanylate cyclase (GGDEF)-like protein/PAS domain S-box-containing protein